MDHQNKKLNILSLDSGGLRGLSSLYILEQMMEVINPDSPPKPCDFFDLIGGAGSGGLIALLLGRLQMDITTCIETYRQLLLSSFPQRILSFRHPKFDSARFVAAMKALLAELGLEPDALLRDETSSCKVVIYLTNYTSQRRIPLTTFAAKECPLPLYETVTIAEAAQTCLSSLANYEPVAIGSQREKYVDCSRTIKNPTRQVWSVANELWPDLLESELGCVVSIGAGSPSLLQQGVTKKMGVVRVLNMDTRSPDKEAGAFLQDHTELDDEGRLFRFNVPNGLGDPELGELQAMEIVVDATRDYVAGELVQKQMRRLC